MSTPARRSYTISLCHHLHLLLRHITLLNYPCNSWLNTVYLTCVLGLLPLQCTRPVTLSPTGGVWITTGIAHLSTCMPKQIISHYGTCKVLSTEDRLDKIGFRENSQ